MMLRISSSVLACHFPSRRARGPAPEWAVWAGRPGAIPSSKTRIRETGGILDTRYLPRRGGRRLVPGLPGHRGALVSQHRHLRLELPHHPHERTRQLRIELRAGPILDVRQGLRLRPRLAVGPVGAERVVHVAHVDELAPFVAVAPGLERGIAVPVQHDVVLVGDHGGQIQVFLGAQDEAGAPRGVPGHQSPLRIGETSPPGEDLRRGFYPSDILGQSRGARSPYLARRPPPPPRTPTAPNRMLERRIWRASVVSIAESVSRASTSSRNCSNSSRLTTSENSKRWIPASASRCPQSHALSSRSGSRPNTISSPRNVNSGRDSVACRSFSSRCASSIARSRAGCPGR